MKPQERQKEIMSLLRSKAQPVTGAEMANSLGVTRQVIVQDIALLRAAGEAIVATPQGYILLTGVPGSGKKITATLACWHPAEDTAEELAIIVETGGKVIDVIVEHPLYGELRGTLMLNSKEDVEVFIKRLNATDAPLLSSLAHGIHLHTVEAPDQQTMENIRERLNKKGYLLPER